MGDIFDVNFNNNEGHNVFNARHLDIDLIDAEYNQPDETNYNERLALGWEMLGDDE